MKSYYRLMLGKKSIYSQLCFDESFVGADFGIHQDLTSSLPDDWREFNAIHRPIFLSSHPGKSMVGAGLACGFLWTVSKGMKLGDILLCPDGLGIYRVGEVVSNYFYSAGEVLPHRRTVRWFDRVIDRGAMSEQLRNSAGSIGTVSNLTSYASEIETLMASGVTTVQTTTVAAIESASEFALEKHLEDFLVKNWRQTELGRDYDIFEEDGELVGQQYQTDTGPMDILAVKKDGSELMVVELKKGRASDAVVGQVLRYMGYVALELAEEHQKVSGVVIALEDDLRVRRALAVIPNVSFFRYEISFKLNRVT
jgi:restriction system protein